MAHGGIFCLPHDDFSRTCEEAMNATICNFFQQPGEAAMTEAGGFGLVRRCIPWNSLCGGIANRYEEANNSTRDTTYRSTTGKPMRVDCICHDGVIIACSR